MIGCSRNPIRSPTKLPGRAVRPLTRPSINHPNIKVHSFQLFYIEWPWIFQFYSMLMKSGIINKEASCFRIKTRENHCLGFENININILFIIFNNK